jgi:hypothetical protein
MIPTDRPVGKSMARVPDQGDDRGLGPYHGSDWGPPTRLRLTRVAIPDRRGRGQLDPTYWQAPGAGVADKDARRSQFAVQGQAPPPRGLQSPLLP